MNLNLPPRARRVLYGLTALGTPVVAYLQVKGIIGDYKPDPDATRSPAMKPPKRKAARKR